MDMTQKETNVTTELARERTREAANRTLMAWIRTSLSMIGFGFSINKIVEMLEAGKSASPFHTTLVFALSFITLGTISLIAAIFQHVWILQRLQMPNFTYAHSTGLTLTVAIFLVIIGFFSFIAVVMMH